MATKQPDGPDKEFNQSGKELSPLAKDLLDNVIIPALVREYIGLKNAPTTGQNGNLPAPEERDTSNTNLDVRNPTPSERPQ